MSRYINYSKFVLIAVGTVIGSSGMAMLIAAIADAVFWSVYGYSHVHDSALLGLIGAFIILISTIPFMIVDEFYN
jgi:hypothetical protein